MHFQNSIKALVLWTEVVACLVFLLRLFLDLLFYLILPTVFCLQSQLFVFNGWGKNGFYSGRISECHLTECLATMKTIHETSQKKSWFQKIWRNVFWQILIDMWEIRCLYRYLFKSPADFVPFTEEILHGKLHFLCSVSKSCEKNQTL